MKSFRLLTCLAALMITVPAFADPAAPIPLWPSGAPGALGDADPDVPTITPYLPSKEAASGAAIVIFPGGGYGGLANHEGDHYAQFLNRSGIACFVVAKPGAALSVEEKTAHMAQRVSGFKMPQSISLLESIPKSDRGKVSKEGLLQIWNTQVKPTLAG